MAQSRLEKIGTIFTRVTGLLRSGAMKPEDKPIWYDVYEAFPPRLEPRFDRPAPNLPIRNIFYEEDIVRAKYHKSVKQLETVNLLNVKYETSTQQFINIYNDLKGEGALDQEQVFNTAKELLAERRQVKEDIVVDAAELNVETATKSTLLSDYKAHMDNKKSNETEKNTKANTGGVNIESLFKD